MESALNIGNMETSHVIAQTVTSLEYTVKKVRRFPVTVTLLVWSAVHWSWSNKIDFIVLKWYIVLYVISMYAVTNFLSIELHLIP